jgi:Spy/CpxP family protein refolding chaperone
MKHVEAIMKRFVPIGFLIAVAAAVGAQEFDLPGGRWWENERLAARIDLTEPQREQIRGVVYEHAHRMIDLGAGLRKAELELANLAADPTFDAAAARAAFGRFQEARRALESERFEMLLAVREVLTTEQWIEIQRIRRHLRRDRERDGPPPLGMRRGDRPASPPPG